MYEKLTAVLLCTALGCAPIAAQNDTTHMREVVVTGTRTQSDLRHLPYTVTQVERDALTHGGRQDILSTLDELVPGLIVTRRAMMGYGVSTGAAGAISVRGLGSTSGQLLMLIDGHPQYNGVYGHALADSYRTLMAERVEVLRGPASLIYGSNAMGGVVNIVTRQQKENGTRAHVNIGAGSYSTVQAEGSVQVRKGKFSSTVGAQYGSSDNHRPDMEFEQYGGFLKLAYDFSSHWKVQGNVDVTHWDASNPGPETARLADNDQCITRMAATINIDNSYNRTSGGVSAYCNSGWHKIDDGYLIDDGVPQTDFFRSYDAMAGVSVWQAYKLCAGNRITAGVDFQCLRGHAYYTDMETDTVVTTGKRPMQSTDKRIYNVAAYVALRQELGKHWTLDAGIRCDHHSVSGSELVPRAGLVYRPLRGGELKAIVSKGFRNPSVKEMFLYGTRNSDLRPECMMNYELAWRQRLLKERLQYGVNLFCMKGRDIIMTVMSDGRMLNMNSGEVQNLGIEADASWNINPHWRVTTNHSLMHMKEAMAYTPVYKGLVQTAYNCGKWNATLALQQLAGLCTVQDGVYADSNCDKESVSLLSASVTYHVASNTSLWINGENLMAQRYEYVAGYPMPRATVMAGITLDIQKKK